MKTKRLLISLPVSEHKKLKKLSEKTGAPMAELVRRALLALFLTGCGHAPSKVGTCDQLTSTVWQCYYTDKVCKFEYPAGGGVRMLECK